MLRSCKFDGFVRIFKRKKKYEAMKRETKLHDQEVIRVLLKALQK